MARAISFAPAAWEQYLGWYGTDRVHFGKINALLSACARDPFDGVGKPERLKGDLAGYWSRRIDQEYRLVYGVFGESIAVLQCRYHYTKK
ncbi:Toxin RelK [Paraburkholderia hiiakae]|uniref:Putative mRNA interferase YoeB n=1 Tax=Paraburkholderia hiiakae TaxID=1081782 RepID=A0ABM8NLQ8_9BURK|nr:Txe/YoeB family addiction module toxin [Paraburkholderia hiiakae]CAD6531928.1 Toxin RelK [Paraburkholderia hiiakae]